MISSSGSDPALSHSLAISRHLGDALLSPLSIPFLLFTLSFSLFALLLGPTNTYVRKLKGF